MQKSPNKMQNQWNAWWKSITFLQNLAGKIKWQLLFYLSSGVVNSASTDWRNDLLIYWCVMVYHNNSHSLEPY